MDINFTTALHAACELGSVEIVRALVQAGADPDVAHPGLDGWTPLHVAAWKGSLACTEVLLECGANRKALDWYGKTPSEWTDNAEIAAALGAQTEHERSEGGGGGGGEREGAGNGVQDPFAQLRGRSAGRVSELHLANIERCLEASGTHGVRQGDVAGCFEKNHLPKSKL
mmetsp:Transcript_102910/g.204261  ORF Transcript_102910/g.204261 Transcript_102910/m.204261 type:complete len:170 (+) Transcript_102910:117-626(+)